MLLLTQHGSYKLGAMVKTFIDFKDTSKRLEGSNLGILKRFMGNDKTLNITTLNTKI